MAVLLFGLAGLFGKLIALPASMIVLGRVVFATLSLAVLLLYRGQDIRLKRFRDYLYLAIQGVILAVHWWTFFRSIQISTVAVGLLTFSTFPVFVAFLEPMIFKEKVRCSDVVVALITLLGVVLVIPRFELGDHITQGALWGTLSGLTFALLAILNRRYVQEYSSLVIAFYQDGIAAIVLLPLLLVIKPVVSPKEVALLILLGVVFTAGAHSLFIKGLANVKARTASIIASLEPVYGIIMAAILLGEIPPLRVILGGGVILSTAYYVTVASRDGGQ